MNYSILEAGRVLSVSQGDVDTKWAPGRMRVAEEAFRSALDRRLKPEGLCREDVCVPVGDRDALVYAEGVGNLKPAHAPDDAK